MELKLKLFILALALLVGGVFLFWPDISEKSELLMSSAIRDAPVSRQLPFDKSSSIADFRLGPASVGNGYIDVINLHGVALPNNEVEASFELVNKGGEREYPSLRLYLVNAEGKPVRIVTYDPDDYAHGRRFLSESIKLRLRLKGEERSFTVEPFYPRGRS